MRAARKEWKRFINSNNLVGMNSSRRRSILHRLQQQSYAAYNDFVAKRECVLNDEENNESDRTSGECESVSPEPEHWTQKLLAETMIRKKQNAANRLSDLTQEEQEVFLKGRCPKAIVFSQHDWDLQVS